MGVMDTAVITLLMEAQKELGIVTNNVHGPSSSTMLSDPTVTPRIHRFVASISYLAGAALQILNFFKWERVILINGFLGTNLEYGAVFLALAA